MHKDFSHPFGDASPQQNHVKHDHSLDDKLSHHPWWLRWSGITLLSIVSLFLILPGLSNLTVASATHHEWLEAEHPQSQAHDTLASKTITIAAGSTAHTVLKELGFDTPGILQLLAASKASYGLHQIIAGHAMTREDTTDAQHVYYEIDDLRRAHMFKLAHSDQWQAKVEDIRTVSRLRSFTGSIEDNLFVSAANAGMNQTTIMNMVDIFSWDVDFARDLREGDQFRVVCEEFFDQDGNLLKNDILAAEFTNQGETYRALRYTKADKRSEYFTPEGRSLRKTYLKSPVKFTRISSRFKTSRKHPVLGYTRAHRGVDYAASTGTPIHSIGEGVVTFAGWKGGYGRFVQIQHTNRNHQTAYAHLHRYGKGIKKGARISQGQLIGYVGSSGLATGPHLHFEFRVRGVAMNPLAVKHKPAKPVPKNEMARFQQQTQMPSQMLEQTLIAANWG